MRDLHLTHLRAVLIIDDEDVQSVLAMLHHLSGDNKASHLQPRRRERLLERIAHSRAVVGGRPIRRRFGLHRFLDRLLLGLRRSLRFAELFNRRRFLPGLRTVWRQCRRRLPCDSRFFLGLRRNTSGKRRDLCGFSRGPCLSRATPPPLMSPDFRRRPLRPSRRGRHRGARSNP
jgi:hypothetical protein